ncbi:MAG TPA: hypothetical protein VM008_06380 [Phycisphaerae bacterium]|nr:hypothetical protein [Phycisphaerae bacterium]
MPRLLKPALLLTAACLLLPACSQTKVPQDLADSLRSVQSDLNGVRASIVSTTNALKDVRDNRGSNIQPQFVVFTDNLATLESKVGGTQVSRDITVDKINAFFQKWDQQINQIQDQDVARSARERQKEIQASFANLKDKVQALKNAYRPYYSSCVDVRTTLGSDMTPQGATIARPAMNAAIDQSSAVLSKLDDVNKTINNMTSP